MIRPMASVLLAVTAAAAPACSHPVPAPVSARPKLVLALAIDQFRYDYLTRFRSEYTGGLGRLLARGAVFTRAHFQHFPTVTAPGHSTYLSGALPAVSGIIGNDWYERTTGHSVTSVSDPAEKIGGGAGPLWRRLRQPVRQRPARGPRRERGGRRAAWPARRDRPAHAELLLQRRGRPREGPRFPRGA